MSRKGRVLIMDDESRWRNALGSILEEDGFYTRRVETSAEALEQLNKELYHLAILDIRMEAGDSNNLEGMNLLRKLDEIQLLRSMEIIMLSAYGTLGQMRRAFADHKVADFLSKDDFDDGEFVKRVRQVFDQKIEINFDLDVSWNDQSGPGKAVLHLEVDGTRIKEDSPLRAAMATELDDLLCRLFFKARSLIVNPLTRGHGGSGVLLVSPFYEKGAGQPVIVKFGDFRGIDLEYSNFTNYVQNYIGGYRSTAVLGLRRTPHLGGVTYSFLGDSSDHIESFADFYARAGIDQIKKALNNLFKETCGEWYANPGQLQPYDLTSGYQQVFRLTPEILSRALNERLKMVQFKHRLIFNSLDGERTFTNPISAAANKSFIKTTYVCVTHGDLNGDNILIDNIGHTWLIDFLSTGPGHILRDVAKLDAVIRFQLLAAEDAPLDERLRMEEALCQAESFEQAAEPAFNFQTENPAVAKAYAAAVHLRSIANRLVMNNPKADINEYYVASLYCALNTIRFYSLPTLQLQHALLSASLLADRLVSK